MVAEGPREVRGAAEPQSSNLERLLEIPVVQASIKEVAEWAVDPNNKMACLVEAVVNTADPKLAVRNIDISVLKDKNPRETIVEMTKDYRERTDQIYKQVLESIEAIEKNRDLIETWADAMHHELNTPLSTASGGLQEVARGEGSPEVVAMFLNKALSGSLRTYLVLKNFQVLNEFSVCENGLIKVLESLKDHSSTSEQALNIDKIAGEVLLYFKKILGDNLLDETNISLPAKKGMKETEWTPEEKYLRHLLFNLMINPLLHGERNSQIVVRKTDDGALEIENEIKRPHPKMELTPQEYAKQIEATLKQQGKVFNGRDFLTLLGEFETQDRQGLGIGLTIARILAAQLGLVIDHQVDVEDNKVRVKIKKG